MYFRDAAAAALTFLSVALSLQKVGHPWSREMPKYGKQVVLLSWWNFLTWIIIFIVYLSNDTSRNRIASTNGFSLMTRGSHPGTCNFVDPVDIYLLKSWIDGKSQSFKICEYCCWFIISSDVRTAFALSGRAIPQQDIVRMFYGLLETV